MAFFIMINSINNFLKTIYKISGFIAAIFLISVASFFSGFMAYYFIKMVIISIRFEERSEGADEILIWIPQTSLAIGSFIFFICVFHHLVFLILDRKID